MTPSRRSDVTIDRCAVSGARLLRGGGREPRTILTEFSFRSGVEPLGFVCARDVIAEGARNALFVWSPPSYYYFFSVAPGKVLVGQFSNKMQKARTVVKVVLTFTRTLRNNSFFFPRSSQNRTQTAPSFTLKPYRRRRCVLYIAPSFHSCLVAWGGRSRGTHAHRTQAKVLLRAKVEEISRRREKKKKETRQQHDGGGD